MTLDELIDFVDSDLSVSCLLPRILPKQEIERLIIKVALPWFYENYQFSVIRSYYMIPLSNLATDEFTQHKYIQLPTEIQTVVWVYQTQQSSLFNLGFGIGTGNGSINLAAGISNTNVVNSWLSTIGELGVYKVVIDSFSDILDQLNKFTLKYDYSFSSKRLQILSPPQNDLILETFTQLPYEDVFELEKFRRYALALSKQQLGRMLTRYTFPLPSGIQMNGDAIKAEGDAEIDKIKEEIKGQSPNSFFMMIKR